MGLRTKIGPKYSFLVVKKDRIGAIFRTIQLLLHNYTTIETFESQQVWHSKDIPFSTVESSEQRTKC